MVIYRVVYSPGFGILVVENNERLRILNNKPLDNIELPEDEYPLSEEKHIRDLADGIVSEIKAKRIKYIRE